MSGTYIDARDTDPVYRFYARQSAQLAQEAGMPDIGIANNRKNHVRSDINDQFAAV